MPKIDIAIVTDTLDPLSTATNFILGVSRAIPNITIYTADGSSLGELKSTSTGWGKLPKILRTNWFKKRRFAGLDLSRHNIVITTTPLAGFVTLSDKAHHVHYVTYSDLDIPSDRIRAKTAAGINHYLADCEVTQSALTLSDSSATIMTPPVITRDYRPARERQKYFVAPSSLKPHLGGIGLDIRYIDSSDSQTTSLLASAWGYVARPDRLDPLILPALASGALVVAPKLLSDIIQSGESGTLYQDTTDIKSAVLESAGIAQFPSSLQRKARRYDQTLFTTKLKKVLIDIYKS